MGRKKQYPNEMLMAALEAHPFNADSAMKSIGICASQWYARWAIDKELIAFKKSLYARLVDMAESVIYQKLAEGDGKMAMFVAERLDKDTWSPRQEVTGADGKDIEIKIDWGGNTEASK